ncbi:MAG: PadR family transcriptional regulator [Betaproteobacteria bacterium]|nr:PadR family transcriptional regulator [Betaproteobacteria bacterium]
MGEKEIYGGLVRLHVLHHASREPIFGQGIMDELARHGYRLSPGTMYPILHGLERGGYLRSSVEKAGRRSRRTYVMTAAGRKALRQAKKRVWELFTELFEEELSRSPQVEPSRRGKSMAKREQGQ